MFELFNLRSDNILTITLIGVKCKVILMVIFGRIKIGKGGNLRYNRILKHMRSSQLFLVFLGKLLLLFIVIKNRGTILGAFVISLTIQGCWVVRIPEYFEKFGK